MRDKGLIEPRHPLTREWWTRIVSCPAIDAPDDRVEHLTFAYAGQPPVFQDFSWQVAAGEAWAVIGPSAVARARCSTCWPGCASRSAGRVLVDGQPVPRPRASTGLILQDYGLLPWATVWENVALVMRMGRFYRGKAGPATMARAPIRGPISRPTRWITGWRAWASPSCSDKYPGQISGGQRQRTAIARSLLPAAQPAADGRAVFLAGCTHPRGPAAPDRGAAARRPA